MTPGILFVLLSTVGLLCGSCGLLYFAFQKGPPSRVLWLAGVWFVLLVGSAIGGVLLMPMPDRLFVWTQPFVEYAIVISFFAILIAYGGATSIKRKDDEKGILE